MKAKASAIMCLFSNKTKVSFRPSFFFASQAFKILLLTNDCEKTRPLVIVWKANEMFNTVVLLKGKEIIRCNVTMNYKNKVVLTLSSIAEQVVVIAGFHDIWKSFLHDY